MRRFLLSLVSAAALAQPAPKLHPELLVSTTWLAAHLKDPDLVILHVADTFADYKRGHVPGARFLATAAFIDNGGTLGAELPKVEALAKAFGNLGLTEKSRIVIYSTAWMPNGARAFFTLDYLGWGDHAALLDGGVEQWLAEDRPITGAVPAVTPTTFLAKPRPEVRATLEEVRKVVEAPAAEATCQVVDARPPNRFQAGHLGGAHPLFWKETLVSDEHPTFLPPEKLRELLAARGLVPGRKAITYCEVGLQASHAYFLFKYLGFEAAMFDGSYQEWSMAKLPVEKEPAK
jgi:thiosulfate/3-mercaptopyruvate sulfurtransferase